jgi:hypothetical protein
MKMTLFGDVLQNSSPTIPSHSRAKDGHHPSLNTNQRNAHIHRIKPKIQKLILGFPKDKEGLQFQVSYSFNLPVLKLRRQEKRKPERRKLAARTGFEPACESRDDAGMCGFTGTYAEAPFADHA